MAFPKQHHEPTWTLGTVGVVNVTDQGAINDMMVCTYNESHIVSAGRYQSHLIECRKAQGYTDKDDAKSESVKEGDDASDAGASATAAEEEPESEIVKCPYNPTHHVHRTVLGKHVALCDSFYKFCMDTQKDPPAIKEEAGPDQEQSICDSSTETDTDTDSEGYYIPPKIEKLGPEEMAKRLAVFLRMRDGIGEDGKPLVLSSPSESDDTDDDDEWFSVSSHGENNNKNGGVVVKAESGNADDVTVDEYDSAIE